MRTEITQTAFSGHTWALIKETFESISWMLQGDRHESVALRESLSVLKNKIKSMCFDTDQMFSSLKMKDKNTFFKMGEESFIKAYVSYIENEDNFWSSVPAIVLIDDSKHSSLHQYEFSKDYILKSNQYKTRIEHPGDIDDFNSPIDHGLEMMKFSQQRLSSALMYISFLKYVAKVEIPEEHYNAISSNLRLKLSNAKSTYTELVLAKGDLELLNEMRNELLSKYIKGNYSMSHFNSAFCNYESHTGDSLKEEFVLKAQYPLGVEPPPSMTDLGL